MQQHLLSPALPSSSADILPAPSPQAGAPSAYRDLAMTTTITTTTTTAVKRKRTDIPDSGTVTKQMAKKKKANRACIHCQKAHLTCDDGSYFASTCYPTFFFSTHTNTQSDWFYVLQQDRANAALSAVCQTTASRVIERRPSTSSTTRNSVSVRFPHISRTGDLILAPEALQREKSVKHGKGANNGLKKKQTPQLEIQQQPRIVSPEPVQMAQTAPIPTCSQALPRSFECS